MTLDLSAVTDTLIGLVKTDWPTAPIWGEIGTPPASSPPGTPPGPTFTPTFTGLAPDAVRNAAGTQLSLYLYHVEPDNAHESLSWGAQLLSPSGPATRFLPLALDLYYLLFAYSEADYHQEHEAMSIALRVFHANPVVRSPAGAKTAWELTLTMEHRSYDELSRLWQATTSPLRTSIVYRASVVFIDPDPAPGPAIKPKTVSVATGQLPSSPPGPRPGYPVVYGTSREGAYAAPGGSEPLASAPACVAAGQTAALDGAELGTADVSDRVYLLDAAGGGEVDVTAWALAAESTPTRFVLTLPGTVGAPPAAAPRPGVYQLRVGSGSPGAPTTVRSGATPLSVAAYVDPSGGPLLTGAGPFTVTGAGFLPSVTEVFVGTQSLDATSAAPAAGQVRVATAGTSLSFVPPAGLTGERYALRVRVNGIESDPALWVTP